MQKTEIHLAGRIYWRVPSGMTHSPPIPAIGGWSVASALAVSSPMEQHVHLFSDDTVLFASNRLVLVSESDNERQLEELAELVQPYLNALRVVTKQPQLPRSIETIQGAMELTGFDPPLDVTRVNSFVRKYIVESAVTVEKLSLASDKLLNDRVPVHCELANDASENTIQSNYRSAIIFAAAAIEACAGTVMDREYENLRTQTSSPAHRLITIQVNKHETIVKDPIYRSLRNGAGEGGSHFLSLLHETPLYLLGRSLKHDIPDTYQQAHSLYRTRNCLAHTGEIDSKKEGLFDVNSSGALQALAVMNDVLEWFGEDGTTIPDMGFIETNPKLDK